MKCTNAPGLKQWLNLPDWFEEDLERSTPEHISYDILYVHIDWSLVEDNMGLSGIVTTRRGDASESSDSASSSVSEVQGILDPLTDSRRGERRPLRSAITGEASAGPSRRGASSGHASRPNSLRFDLPPPRTTSPVPEEPPSPTPTGPRVPRVELAAQPPHPLAPLSGYTLAQVPHGAWPPRTDTRQLSASRDSVPLPRSAPVSRRTPGSNSRSGSPSGSPDEAPRFPAPRVSASDFRFAPVNDASMAEFLGRRGPVVSGPNIPSPDEYFRSRFGRIESNEQLLEAQRWIWHLRARRSMQALAAHSTAQGIEQAQLSLRQLMETCERLLSEAHNTLERINSDYMDDNFLMDRMMEYSWRQLNRGPPLSSSAVIVPTALDPSRIRPQSLVNSAGVPPLSRPPMSSQPASTSAHRASQSSSQSQSISSSRPRGRH